MGVVYKGRDTNLDRDVALKFLPSHLSGSGQDRARFIQEAKAAALLNHPNVCTIHNVEEHEGSMFIVMECVEGGTLSGKVPFKNIGDAVSLSIQIGEALQEAHTHGIIHRDIKSDNVMLTAKGQVKVMDFGLAKLRGSLQLTKTSTTVGTLAYMAPEQIQGGEADARSDIFSFGVVFFEMLTGKKPFRGEHEAAIMYSVLNEAPEPATRFREDIPPGVNPIITRLLDKDPNQRYQSMDGVLSDLKKLEAGATDQKKSTPSSIAVMAFGDMSPQKDQDYLCEGLAEELINALTKIKTLRVSARTSAFAFKGKQMDIREIGTKLNVETVLEGSVKKSGNRLRISAQLINVTDGYHLWSERYDRDMKDVFEIQDEITENIAQALKLVLTDQEKESIASVPTPEIEAYEFYLRGRKLLNKLRMGNQEAIAMFTRSAEIDPNYALAHCGLADCHSFAYFYWESTDANLQTAEEASRRAVELNPELAEARASLGYALSLKKNYEESDREFEKAISLDPQLFEVYYYYARTCFVRGEFPKAARLFEEAVRVRPDDYQAPALVSTVYRSLKEEGKYQEALRLTRKNVTRHLELNPDDARAYYLGGMSLILLGESEKGEEWFARALKIEPDNVGTYYNIGCLYAQVGKKEKSIEFLQKSVDLGFAHRAWMEHDADLDPVRDDPRFKELLLRVK
jgi:serine/threonine protein kinase/Flp pilus assembly protein TadD